MSHDRGCWKCGRDPYEYEECVAKFGKDCFKYAVVMEFFGKLRVRVKAGSKRINGAE